MNHNIKTHIVVLLTLFVLSLTLPGEAYFMVIDVIQKKAGSVFFPHHRHLSPKEEKGAGISCKRCHHELQGAKDPNQTPVLCTTNLCHSTDKEIAKKTGILFIKKAFHNLCKNCHKASRKLAVKPPTKCKGCHKKALIPFTKLRREQQLAE